MSIFLHALLLAVAIVLQKTALFSINDITPDFVLILVVAIAIQHGSVAGVLVGFFSGLILDAVGTEFVGLSSLSKCAAGYLAGSFGSERLEKRFTGIVGLLFLIILLHDFLYYNILSIGTPTSFFGVFFKLIIPSTCYTLVFIIILHMVWPRAIWGSK